MFTVTLSIIYTFLFNSEKLVEVFVRLALGEETEMSVSEFESKLSKDTVQLVRVALGSLNEPAYTAWISMTEYAISRGRVL